MRVIIFYPLITTILSTIGLRMEMNIAFFKQAEIVAWPRSQI
jgi:hypothetical protein